MVSTQEQKKRIKEKLQTFPKSSIRRGR